MWTPDQHASDEVADLQERLEEAQRARLELAEAAAEHARLISEEG